MMIIDPPSPFSALSEWRAFLEEMLELRKTHPDDEMLQEHIDMAHREIAGKEKERDTE
jgi:hypothetical protein